MIKKLFLFSLLAFTAGILNAQGNLIVKNVKTGKIIREIKPGTPITYNLVDGGIFVFPKKARLVKAENGIITVKPNKKNAQEITFNRDEPKVIGYRTTMSVIVGFLNGPNGLTLPLLPGTTFQHKRIKQGKIELETSK